MNPKLNLEYMRPAADGQRKDRISWWRTSFGEEEIQRVAHSILNEHISQGPVTEEFEARIAEALGVPYAVATTSGSVALLVALMALGIRRGDEVIVPNRTWIATAHAPLMLGAEVVLVDVQPDLPIMDVSQVKRKITSKTRAIMPVHLGGRAADMGELGKLAKEYGLFIIEDAAQALFSQDSSGFLGTNSDAGCFSLSVAKLISTGQGGFIVTRDRKTYEDLRLIRTHGVRDVINADYTQIGFNFRFTDLQASIGVEQLARATKRIAYVKELYSKYASALPEFPFLKLIPVAVAHGEIPLYIEVLCSQRERLISFLESQSIQTRPFYPDLDMAAHLGKGGGFTNSRVFGEQGLFLPCGPTQPFENIERVLDALRLFGKLR